MDASDYRPAPQVLDQLKQVDFVAVVGPTAAGKTTLIREAMAAEPLLHMLTPHVSRAPRPDEQDGVDYYFGTKADMTERVKKAEYATVVIGVSGDIYATAPEDYQAHAGQKTIMPVIAQAMHQFRSLPLHSFRTIFIVPPSWELWQERIEAHHFLPEQLAKRLAEARVSLEFALEDSQTALILNQDLATAAQDLIVLATGQPLPDRLQQDQARARAVVRNLLAKL